MGDVSKSIRVNLSCVKATYQLLQSLSIFRKILTLNPNSQNKFQNSHSQYNLKLQKTFRNTCKRFQFEQMGSRQSQHFQLVQATAKASAFHKGSTRGGPTVGIKSCFQTISSSSWAAIVVSSSVWSAERLTVLWCDLRHVARKFNLKHGYSVLPKIL